MEEQNNNSAPLQSQAVATSQQNGNSVKKEAIRKKLENDEEVLYEDTVSAGFVFLFDKDFNRTINKPHVKELKANFLLHEACLEPIDVIFGNDYDCPKHKFEDVYGKEQTLSQDSLIVLDGQHRLSAWNTLSAEEKESFKKPLKAMMLHIPESMTASEWIVEKNSTSMNWTSKDRSHAIASTLTSENNNLSKAREWQANDRIGERMAYAILNFEDSYKKKLYEDYMRDPSNGLPTVLEGTPEHRDRGEKLFKSLKIGFRKHKKCLKNMASIKFVIEVYGKASDKNNAKAEIVDLLNLFFRTLKETVAEDIEKASTEDKQKILHREWAKFYDPYANMRENGQDVTSLRKSLELDAAKAEADYKKICEEEAKKKAGKKK